MNERIKLIAFFLPQFHPIPENDEWWGRGFTEWTNVAKARPQFPGHYQPHLPADLGFYDLRLPEVREAQAAMAREYGIHAFCYYHYWFSGRRLIERPVEEILASGSPDFPFCLCWANESWSRRWDGMETEVLMKQEYSPEDDERHGRYLMRVFKDPRYLRIDGKPVFLMYKGASHPDAAAMLKRWRSLAKEAGIGGLFLCNVESTPDQKGIGPVLGFDASVEFAPDWGTLPKSNRDSSFWRAVSKASAKTGIKLPFKNASRHCVHSYAELAERMQSKPQTEYYRVPCVTPSWDNAARRKEMGRIFHGSTPALYQKWLADVVRKERANSRGKGLVFVNAWNEWAEGNHLEPCQKWGRAYLEATRSALQEAGAWEESGRNGKVHTLREVEQFA